MRIGIDARFWGIENKGLGRYTEKLLGELEKKGKENQYFIFLRKSNYHKYQPQNDNFKKVLADFAWYSWKEQFFFPRLLEKYKLDMMHFTHFNVPWFYSGQFVVTIHDLTLFNFPTRKNSTHHWIYYKIKYGAYRQVIKRAIEKARKIIVISQFTAKDILKHFGKDNQSRIEIIYEAPTVLPSGKTFSDLVQKYQIHKPYLLYVGNAYPHKNLERLVRAFSIFSQQFPRYQLILIGKNDYFYQRLQKYIRQNKISAVKMLDTVNDDELKVFYQEADLFVFPSLYEGFGLPPLEAMLENLPVISSDHSCMKEVLGKSAYYFNGKDTISIAEAMKKVIGDRDLRTSLIQSGRKQAQRYSWEKMGEKTLQVYNSLN